MPKSFWCVLCTCLSLLAADGVLKVKSQPSDAGVFLDGKYLGPAKRFATIRSYSVAAGDHELRLSDPRYEDSIRKVSIESGKTLVVSEALKQRQLPKPPFGTIRTIHPDNLAAVYVNGQFMGHVDEFDNFAQGIKLNPGVYEVKIVPVATGSPVSRTVTVEANKVVIVR